MSPTVEQKMREHLSKELGKRPYRMWFTNTKVQCEDDGVAILAATPLAANWITKRFSSVIEDAAKNAFGREMQVHIAVDESLQPEKNANDSIAPQEVSKTTRQHKRKLLSFDDFVVGECNQLAHAAAKQITQEEGKTISPLFIHGSCGVGKTHLLQAICKLAAKTSIGKVRYVTG